MIPTSQLATTGRTTPADTGSMINMDVYPASDRVQRDVGNKLRVAHELPPAEELIGSHFSVVFDNIGRDIFFGYDQALIKTNLLFIF